eukprot:g4196.t1
MSTTAKTKLILIGAYRKKNKENLSNLTKSFEEGAKYKDKFEAAFQGDVHWLRLELGKPENANTMMSLNAQKRNIMHEACRGGYVQLVRFLFVQESLDIPKMLRETDVFGFNPRQLAARRGKSGGYQECIDAIDKYYEENSIPVED